MTSKIARQKKTICIVQEFDSPKELLYFDIAFPVDEVRVSPITLVRLNADSNNRNGEQSSGGYLSTNLFGNSEIIGYFVNCVRQENFDYIVDVGGTDYEHKGALISNSIADKEPFSVIFPQSRMFRGNYSFTVNDAFWDALPVVPQVLFKIEFIQYEPGQ